MDLQTVLHYASQIPCVDYTIDFLTQYIPAVDENCKDGICDTVKDRVCICKSIYYNIIYYVAL